MHWKSLVCLNIFINFKHKNYPIGALGSWSEKRNRNEMVRKNSGAHRIMRPTCATAEYLKWAQLLTLIIAKCKNSTFKSHMCFQSQLTVPKILKISQPTHFTASGEI